MRGPKCTPAAATAHSHFVAHFPPWSRRHTLKSRQPGLHRIAQSSGPSSRVCAPFGIGNARFELFIWLSHRQPMRRVFGKIFLYLLVGWFADTMVCLFKNAHSLVRLPNHFFVKLVLIFNNMASKFAYQFGNWHHRIL